jgi:hypothetical protein
MADNFLVIKPEGEEWLHTGQLIYDIAVGAVPIPDSAAGRMELLTNLGVEIDPQVTDVQFHVSDITTMHVMIPPRSLIEQARTGSRKYDIPEPYKNYTLGNSLAYSPEEMFLFRIGDYCISHCR